MGAIRVKLYHRVILQSPHVWWCLLYVSGARVLGQYSTDELVRGGGDLEEVKIPTILLICLENSSLMNHLAPKDVQHDTSANRLKGRLCCCPYLPFLHPGLSIKFFGPRSMWSREGRSIFLHLSF